MTEPNLPPADDLERRLSDLRPFVAFPATPDLAGAARARIARQARPPRRPAIAVRSPRLWVAAILLLLLIAALGTRPIRHSIAGVLGVPGITISFVHRTPTPPPPPSPVGATIGLGEPVTLATAVQAANFAVTLPDPAIYGDPDGVYLRQLPDGGTLVSLLYAPDSHLPEAAETGMGMLIMQFVSTGGPTMLIKGVMGNGTVTEVAWNNARGFWVAGTSELTILDNPAVPTCCQSRSSANVLIWQASGVTYRLETALSLDDALVVAKSMTPIAFP